MPWDSGESMGGAGRRFQDLDLAVLPDSAAACFTAGGLAWEEGLADCLVLDISGCLAAALDSPEGLAVF